MQFYLQAAVVERGVDQRHYNLCRLDVIMGCIFTDVIAFFIVVACGATVYHSQHHEITDVAQAALALRPVAGKFASLLFAVGLVNASLLVGRDTSACHLLQHLRGAWLRVGTGQAILGSAYLLLAVHASDWRRSGFRPHSRTFRFLR